MRDSDADIAINTLNKLITQELKAARAGSCQGNRPLEECATTRSNAYAFARDKIKEALAKAKALAEHAGKVEIADLVTGRCTIIKQARKGNRR